MKTLATKSRSSKKYIAGQGMSEYLIIIGLVAVAGIGVMSFFSQTVQHQVAGITTELSGGDGSTEVAAAVTTAASAVTSAAVATNLGNYDSNN